MAGGGGLMVTMALSALAIRVTSWATSHTKLLDGAMIGSTVFAVGLFVCWLYTKDDLEEKNAAPGSSANVAGSGNSGDLMNASGNVHKGDINYYLPPNVEVPPRSEKPRPTLVIRSPQKVWLEICGQIFRRSEDGDSGLIVMVDNPEAAVGQQVIKAQRIAAVIRFSREDGELIGTSERVYWLNTLENRVTILPGQSKAIVIGIYDNPAVWLHFTNKRDNPIPTPRTATQMRGYANAVSQPLDEPSRIFFNPTIDAQVTVITESDGYIPDPKVVPTIHI